ncbi:MAG: hypothetical protein ABSC65_17250 [Acidobacteriaceae bacterium]|jgi:hypothetical protein
MKRMVISGLALLLGASAFAQTNSPPIKGMASTVGLYVYPKNHQNGTQQLTDESQCYSNAKSQTGYDPNATTTAAKPEDKKSDDKPVAKGAARGAVISGATGGDAAAGARRGAIIGSVKAKREEKKEADQQKQADAAKTASQQPLDNFKRSLSSCLDSRGYSVK